MAFEWNDDKAKRNLNKPGVSFEEAITVFSDDLAETYFDPSHSKDEDRFITIGYSQAARLLIVSHTNRDESVRIISTREADRREQKDYEDGKQ